MKLLPGDFPNEQARMARAEQLHACGYNLYFAPNGGPKKADVVACPVLFIEWDKAPLEWQITACDELGLPAPTASVNTGGKSIHHHWRLDPPMPPAEWEQLIRKLISVCGADPACSDASRVMRLPGSHYWPKDGSLGKVLKPGQDPRQHLKVARALPNLTPLIYPPQTFIDRVAGVDLAPPAQPIVESDAVRELLAKFLPPSLPAGQHRADTITDVRDALACIPPRQPGTGTYPEYRNLLWGLRKVIEGLGGTDANAAHLMAAHSPAWGLRAVQQVLRSGGDGIDASTFWWHAQQHGYENKRAIPKPDTTPPGPPLPTPQQLQAEPELADDLHAAARQLARQVQFTITLQDVLPDSIALPLIQRARSFPCDPLAMLLPLLCTTASIVGRRARVQIKQGWDEPFVLWGANVMPPSSMKSPIAGVFERPLDRWQAQINREHKAAQAEWKRLRGVVIDDLMQANGLSRKAAEEHPDLQEWDQTHPQPAVQARTVTVCDATFEAIGKALANDLCSGIVSFQDELATWYGSLQRGQGQGGTNHRSRWISTYGGGKIDVRRATAGSESFFVERTGLSLFGSIQPDALLGLRQQEIKYGATQAGVDGMWSRFLFAQPDAIEWEWTDLECSITDLVGNLYTQIDTLLPPFDPEQPPHLLRFESDARALLIPQLNAWKGEAKGSPNERQWFLGKLRGTSLRLAGVLHILKLAPQGLGKLRPIDTDTVRRALLLSKWFLAQFDALQPAIGGETAGVPAVIAKLVAKVSDPKWDGQPVTVRQGQDWSITGTKGATADEVRAVFEAAVAAGMGRIETTARSVRWWPPHGPA